jgi:hypothetical protein
MSSGRRCQYTTQPEESRSSALRRSKAYAEQRLREVHRDYKILLRLVYSLISYDDTVAITTLHQLRQSATPTVIVQEIDRILQCGNTADATKKILAGHIQCSLNQERGDDLPSIASWYCEDGEAYEELFMQLRSATQEKGIEVIRRIRQGESISDILNIVKDATPDSAS